MIEIKNENNPCRARRILIPGVYRTYRIAVVNDSKKFPSGRLDCAFTRFHCKIARNMKRKPSPLAPKMKLTPANGSKSEEMMTLFACSVELQSSARTVARWRARANFDPSDIATDHENNCERDIAVLLELLDKCSPSVGFRV